MSHQTAAPQKKHLRTLERRIAYLEGRIAEHGDLVGQGAQNLPSISFDQSELSALRVAHQVMRLYRDQAAENAPSTPRLLLAAAVLLSGAPFAEDRVRQLAEDLVHDLRERASLLAQLDE